MKIVILSDRREVTPFIDVVRREADANRDALGFLPERVYREAAEQAKLLVAVALEGTEETYAGHLLFGGVFPRARIFQLFVSPYYRGKGIGRRLVERIIAQMEENYYLSIGANVAADLTEGNAFWDKLKFGIVQTKPGGVSRGRSINIRVRDLDTPSLFNLTKPVAEADYADLRLVERLSSQAPVYAIDLNVLFDVVEHRVHAEQAGLVIRAGFQNLVRLAVTEEFVEELRRWSMPNSRDPVLALALELPRLMRPPERESRSMIEALAGQVFPQRAAEGRLSCQDRSDLVHLATAIHHNVAGFITGEKAILRARESLQRSYGVDVIGVGEFAETVVPSGSERATPLRATIQGARVCAAELTRETARCAQSFLERMYVPYQLRADVLAVGGLDSPRRRVLLNAGEEVVAFASWTVPHAPNPVTDAFVCADEDHLAAETAVEYLLGRISREASRTAPGLIRLHQLPGRSVTRRIAIALGFRASEGRGEAASMLQKISVGRPVSSSNWSLIRVQLKALAGIGLPERMPRFVDHRDTISVDSPSGARLEVTLRDLERLLSPVLFVSGSRAGVVLPIRQRFAESLLDSPQFQLLDSREAAFLNERTYFNSPQSASVIAEGAPLLFYESGNDGGRSAIIAVARAVRVTLGLKGAIESSIQRRGVVDSTSLERIGTNSRVTVTRFDNVMMFERPVKFARLRELGCVDRSNFVTARRVSPQHLTAILEEGRANG